MTVDQMTGAAWLVAGTLAALVIRDILYRYLIMRPMTTLSGRQAVHIEATHTYRWLVPVLAGESGDIDVYFAGNSHIMDAVDPRVVTSESGYTCYNLAIYAMPSQHAVHMLGVYERYPRLLFVDFSTRYGTYRPGSNLTLRAFFDKAASASPLAGWLYALADRASWIAPSLFVPRQFSPVIARAIGKAWHFRKTGRMAIGRYTPFRPFVSYDWSLDKTTNHRIARRVRPRSRWEREREEYLVGLRLSEMAGLCDVSSDAYLRGIEATRTMFDDIRARGVKVVFMRLPLHPKIVEAEDRLIPKYFEDLKSIATEHGFEWLDLNKAEHLAEMGPLDFYSDGHHLCHPCDVAVSRYLGKLVREQLATHGDS